MIVSWKSARGENNMPFDGGDKYDQTLSSAPSYDGLAARSITAQSTHFFRI